MVRFRLLIVVGFAAALLMTGVGMIVPLLPQRVMDLSGSLQSTGLIAAAFACAYLLVQLPLGRLADRLGVKPFLLLGYLFCAAAGVLFCFAGSVGALFFGRFIQGIGEAPIWALGPALLSLAYPLEKGRVIGLYNAAIHAGLTAGPLLGLLLFPAADSNLPFLAFAGLCGLGAVTLLVFLPRQNGPRVARPATLRETLALLRLRGPLVTLAGILLYGAGYGVFITVLPASLALSKSFDSLANGVLFTLFYGAISVAQIVFGPLTDRHGRHGYMVAGLAMSALGFASFMTVDHPWTYLPLMLASLGLGVFCVASMAYLNDRVPAALKGTISSAYYLAWGLGYFAGPLLVGALGAAGFIMLAALFALQALAQLRSRRALPHHAGGA